MHKWAYKSRIWTVAFVPSLAVNTVQYLIGPILIG